MNTSTPHQAGRASLALHGPVAVITLSNEARMNAIDGTIADDLCSAVHMLASDPNVRVLLLQGRGGQAFCAGMDIKYAAATGDRDSAIAALDQRLQTFLHDLQKLRIPVVALLQGVCFGAGVHLALAADFRLADNSVRLSVPALKNKLMYPIDALQRLRAIAGAQRATRILLEGGVYLAPKLSEWGLVDTIFEPHRATEGAMAFCIALADKDRAIVRDYLEIFEFLDQRNVVGANLARDRAKERLRLGANDE